MNLSLVDLLGKRIAILSLCIIWQSLLFAQREYDLLGKGARAAGMAYAFTALSDDATAMSWNPAGIVQVKKPELALVNSIAGTKYRHEYVEYDYKPSYSIDYAGIVYPFKIGRKDLVFGLSYHNRMNYKFSYNNLPNQFGQSNGSNSLMVNTFSFSTAYSVFPFAGLAFAYNRWFSAGNEASNYYLIYSKELYKDNISFMGDSLPDKEIMNTHENFSYSGNNFVLGILLDFKTMGVPVRYSLKYETEFVLDNNYDWNHENNHSYYDEKVDSSLVILNKGMKSYDFPGILTNAISFRLGDYLTIAGEFDIRLYHDNRERWDYSSDSTLWINGMNIFSRHTNQQLNSPFQYASPIFNQYRIGIEYILHPEFALIPVRAGWKNNPAALNTYNEDHEAVKRVMASSINIGTGLVFRKFSVDMAYEAYWYERYDEQYALEKKTCHYLVLSANWYIK
jgi:hypothetical protein